MSSLSSSNQTERQRIRRDMRARRKALSAAQRRVAARRLACHLARHPLLQQASRVALYIGHRGELDPWLFHQAWSQGKQLYLPVLAPGDAHLLRFVRAEPPWQRNRFGIPEPVYRRQSECPPWQLDVLLMPLVAFDRQGGRLGMGGGFYDRTLGQLSAWSRRPWCLGIGYRFQETENLPLADWDQPLDGIITD